VAAVVTNDRAKTIILDFTAVLLRDERRMDGDLLAILTLRVQESCSRKVKEGKPA
jgi:hypothetical protein